MLWVAEGTSATVVISVESAMEVMAAWKVMKDIMAVIVDLQVMVATTVDTVLVMVVKGAMDHDVETKVEDMVVLLQDIMVTKEKTLAVELWWWWELQRF